MYAKKKKHPKAIFRKNCLYITITKDTYNRKYLGQVVSAIMNAGRSNIESSKDVYAFSYMKGIHHFNTISLGVLILMILWGHMLPFKFCGTAIGLDIVLAVVLVYFVMRCSFESDQKLFEVSFHMSRLNERVTRPIFADIYFQKMLNYEKHNFDRLSNTDGIKTNFVFRKKLRI